MRSAANRAMQQADPSVQSAPASFSQEKATQQTRAPTPPSNNKTWSCARCSLTSERHGYSPTEHMSLETTKDCGSSASDSAEPPRASSVVSKSGAGDGSAAKSSNVAHLMQLLKRKQHCRAVMSILQKLKGMSNGASTRPAAPQPQQGEQAPPRSDNASRMWFSDKIVAHKDRVESNVQKLVGCAFREQAQLDAHLDFLFQYNRSLKNEAKTAPRESTSSSFFDRTQKENEKNAGEQASWENARVPVDETITRCRTAARTSRSWDEEEEDWMYTNAVAGTIHNTGPNGNEQQDTIFHKYCYDTVMANSKHVTPAHLIPAERDVAMKGDAALMIV
ncbi:hypothetical protein GQ600_22271 [Phytophthora cactorum]|nr:hypothetical protein GQ600_22271 [Phytophthora cactorum]